MKKRNYKNRNNISKLYSNDLLDRVLLVKRDLEHLDKAINELRIYRILDPNVLKENVKFVVKSVGKNRTKYERDTYYHKLFKERVPIYKQEVQLQEIIADSIQLTNVLSVAWEEEKEKKFIMQWLLYLYDNIQKINLVVLALEQCITHLDEQLDFYFEIKGHVKMFGIYMREILTEYSNKYNLHLKTVS